MGNCLSSASPQGAKAAGPKEDAVTDVVKRDAGAADAAAAAAVPEPLKPHAPSESKVKAQQQEEQEEEPLQLACPGEVPNAVVNPDTDLILNMLDPENGPAAGLPYQVHYLGPPRPPCEAERLATVELLGKVNDALGPDPEIQSILTLVANVFKAPAALCALFDSKRVFISEQQGDVIPCGTFPWRWTLCGWSMAFKNPQVLVIQDTLQDSRFRNNEKVTVSPRVRFYCGTPLLSSNKAHRYGTLCFADVKPRKFDMASCVLMNNLSELVVRQLEKDMAIRLKEKANKQLLDTFRNLQRAVDCYEHCVVLLDTSQEGWKVMYANAAWAKHTGLSRDQLVGGTLSEALEATDGTQLPSPAMLKAVRDLKAAKVPLARVKDANVTKTFALTFRPAGRQVLDESTIPIGVPSFLALDGEDDVAHRFYFMTIAAPSERKDSSSSSSQFGGMSSLLSSYSSSSILESSIASSLLGSAATNNSMQGLELAHLLGRGSFGWVYYGLWYGTPVAVKLIDEDVRPSAKQQIPGSSRRSGESASVYSSAAGGGGGLVPHLEALMAHELRHPNIVATLKYGTTMVPCGRELDLEDYAPGNNNNNQNASAHTGSNAASGPQALLPPPSPQQAPPQADAGATPSISAPHNAIMAAALASNTSSSAAAMVTAQSGLAVVSGSHAGVGAGAGGNSSLLSSTAEEQIHSGAAAATTAAAAAAGGEGVAVPHGWVVIDAAAGAAPDELEEEDGGHEGGRGGGGKEEEGSAAMNAALQVRPDAWQHLAPAGQQQQPQGVLLSSNASGAQLLSASSAVASSDGASGKEPAASPAANGQQPPASPAGLQQGKSAAAVTPAQQAPAMMKQTWMVMEFCDRGTVQDAIDRGWLRTERDCLHSQANWLAVVATAYDIASAMQYLHAHDVVHGDLTGWNVMLSSSGAGSTLGQRGFVAKVADFGLSRCMEMRTTIQTKTYGTLSHMPPELLAHGTMSKAVDVYSFGVLLWQMYSGSRPWSGLTHAQIIYKVVQDRQRLHWGPDALPAYHQLAEACMSYDAQARPGFAAVVETLDALRSSLMG